MKNYAALADLRLKTALHIKKAFDRGYEQGYNDCKVELLEDEAKCHYQEGYNDGYKKGVERRKEACVAEADCAYQCGLNRAWNVARKIVLSDADGGIPNDNIPKIYSTSYYSVMKNIPVQEAVAKLEAWEKKQERYCYNCGQPRDYKNSCIPYKEGKCDKSHKAWIPKQEETEKKCENCKWMELDCNNPAICKDMVLYEPKEKDVKDDIYAYVRDATPEESKSVNAYIKSISEETGVTFNGKEEQTTTLCGKCIHAHNMHDNILTCDAVPCVIEDGHCDKYEEKQEHSDIVPAPPLVDCNECAKFQVDCSGFGPMKSHCTCFKKKQEETEKNVESIAVWDEVEDNLGNRMVVTHIYSDGKYANADVIDADGCFRSLPLELLEKTGRRFCFQELLNAMKKDDVEEAETNENK